MLDRANASRILIELSARARGAADPAKAEETQRIIVGALHDADENVRGETINCLEKFGTDNMIPALRQVAESEPAISKTNHIFWLRGRAAKAISAIQERASQH